jgi:hypothetical protein
MRDLKFHSGVAPKVASRKLYGRANVFSREMRISGNDVVDCRSAGHQFQKELDANPGTSDAGLSA